LLAQCFSSVELVPSAPQLHTSFPTQKLVFGAHTMSRHAPAAQSCVSEQDLNVSSVVPSTLQRTTFAPSQRMASGSHSFVRHAPRAASHT
jgi:hypothetical protein